MKKWIQSPQTTIGAAMAIAGIIMCVTGKDTVGTVLIGTAAVWIGVTAKDAKKEG